MFMKKSKLMLALFVSLFVFTQAQAAEDDYASPFSVYAGVNAGVSIYSGTAASTGSKAAASMGIDFGIQTNSNWTLGAFVTFLDSPGALSNSVAAFGLEPNLLFNKSNSYFRLGARIGAISYGTTEFLIGPVVGFGINLAPKTVLDFSLGFEIASSISRFDPRVGVRFYF